MARDSLVRAAPDPSAILDLLATAILVVDPQGNVAWLNAAAADLLSTSPVAAHGRRLATLVVDGAAIESLIARSRESQDRLRSAVSSSRPRRAAMRATRSTFR